LNWFYILPEIIIAGTAAVIVITDLIRRNPGLSTILALAGIAASFVCACICKTPSGPLFDGMLLIDGWSRLTRALVLIVAAGVIAASKDYQDMFKNRWAEYNALALFALLGMVLMAAAGNLISAFVAIEVTTISFFILVGIGKNPRSSEASLKMLLTGAIASAVLLYGMAFIFGISGGTGLTDIGLGHHVDPTASSFSAGLLIGMFLIMAGLFFEIGAVPFHMWLPDTYEGAPTPVTMYLSGGSKIAGIAIIARVFSVAFTNPQALGAEWGVVMAVISAITMTLGNILALRQSNIKRLLAYSGIAHTGYMLIGIASIGMNAQSSGGGKLFFYMAAFALAEVAVFTAIIILTRQLQGERIADFAGLARRSPLLFAILSIGLLSLMGIPLTAGFMAKLFIFTSALESGLLWLVIIAVINTVISAYYYLSIIRVMWSADSTGEPPVKLPKTAGLVSLLAGAAVIILGIAPSILLKLAEKLIALP
jgi:NADH-quinone oxidoreductase subunit N